MKNNKIVNHKLIFSIVSFILHFDFIEGKQFIVVVTTICPKPGQKPPVMRLSLEAQLSWDFDSKSGFFSPKSSRHLHILLSLGILSFILFSPNPSARYKELKTSRLINIRMRMNLFKNVK